MKAVILAAGSGRRLRPHVTDVPKCLVPVEGARTIIDRQLDAFRSAGVERVVVATGYLAAEVERHVHTRHADLACTFVHNPRYAETNYIYTLHLCRRALGDDIFLVHGDLVFDERVLPLLLATGGSCVPLRDTVPGPDYKDFRGVVEGGLVKRIGVDCRGSNAFPLLPLYRLLHGDMCAWLDRIDKFIADGNDSCYAENALNEITDTVLLKPVYLGDLLCDEIDTVDDLERMRRAVAG